MVIMERRSVLSLIALASICVGAEPISSQEDAPVVDSGAVVSTADTLPLVIGDERVATRSEDVGGTGPDVDSLRAAIDSLVPAVMAAERIPGAAVVVVADGEVVHSAGYGMADLESGEPVTANGTIFRIGSISKALTALGVARLIDQGRITLDTPVADYLDGDFTAGPNGTAIRVRHLLSHTGGFDQTGLGRHAESPESRSTLAAFVEAHARPIREPGVVGVYDTYGITLAGRLIEAATDRSYAEYMRDSVFLTLGMRRSWVETPAEYRAALAVGYGLEDGSPVEQAYEWYVTLPASSIDATTSDMGRLMVALLGDGGGLYSAEMASRVREERLLGYGDMGAFSWGFWEATAAGHRVLHHGGVMRGYSSELFLVPDERFGFFVAYNRDPETGSDPRLREALTELATEIALADEAADASDPTADSLGSAPDPVPVPVERIVGAYGSTVACYTCTEGEGWGFGSISVAEEAAGVISLYGGDARFHAVDSLIFVSDASGRELRFLADGRGRVRYMVQGPNSFAKLDSTLLDEVLGAGWEDRPVEPLEAKIHRAAGHWEASARAYAAVQERNPQNGRLAFYEGFGWINAGQFEASREAFRRAIALDQWVPSSRYYMAAAAAGQRDSDAARAALEGALEAGFTDGNLLDQDPWWGPYREEEWFIELRRRLES